jgi:hypothetical protein
MAPALILRTLASPAAPAATGGPVQIIGTPSAAVGISPSAAASDDVEMEGEVTGPTGPDDSESDEAASVHNDVDEDVVAAEEDDEPGSARRRRHRTRTRLSGTASALGGGDSVSVKDVEEAFGASAASALPLRTVGQRVEADLRLLAALLKPVDRAPAAAYTLPRWLAGNPLSILAPILQLLVQTGSTGATAGGPGVTWAVRSLCLRLLRLVLPLLAPDDASEAINAAVMSAFKQVALALYGSSAISADSKAWWFPAFSAGATIPGASVVSVIMDVIAAGVSPVPTSATTSTSTGTPLQQPSNKPGHFGGATLIAGALPLQSLWMSAGGTASAPGSSGSLAALAGEGVALLRYLQSAAPQWSLAVAAVVRECIRDGAKAVSLAAAASAASSTAQSRSSTPAPGHVRGSVLMNADASGTSLIATVHGVGVSAAVAARYAAMSRAAAALWMIGGGWEGKTL